MWIRRCLTGRLNLTCLGLALLAYAPLRAAQPQTQAGSPQGARQRGIELFEKYIRPVLVDKCYECHSKSAETIEAGLELDSPAGLTRGGDSGPVINRLEISGNSQQNATAAKSGQANQATSSLLLRVLRHEDGLPSMPPDEKLSEEILRAFQQWIQLGAPDPRESTGVSAAQLQFERRRQHWAFQLPLAADPPAVEQADWPRSPIDTFILARLESQGLHPVHDANRATLVRRLYFDLIGLPPTPEQVREVVEDTAPNAVTKLVDRLLASSRFGERWARHWLDVVRFAESSGKEFNFTYPHAWPYRDYVIDALNHDKPYDQFVVEQIAGDLLPAEPYESAADREARLIAPSMLAFGPKRHNSGGMDFRMGIVDDQIDVTCRAFLGLTVACAKCHDHKFDPIPTKDYYALAGIFLSTEPLYGTIKQKYSNNPTDLLPIGPNGAALHAAASAYEKKMVAAEKPWKAKQEELKKAEAALKAATLQKKEAAKKASADKKGTSDKKETGEPNTEKRLAQTGQPVQPNGKKLAAGKSGVTKPADQTPQQAFDAAVAQLAAAGALVTKLKGELAPLQTAVETLKKHRPPRPPYAMSARDRAKPADTKIAIRGDFRKPGATVPRGFLSALEVADAAAVNPAHSGRLELARWLTSTQNPLPARVMVNRIWYHLFGRGLVESVDNFGLMGKKPSHPQLLDTLAVQFSRDGWSVKQMIRSIVLSRTYQLSSQVDATCMERDPDNRLLWRATPRRLSVEVIRDAILAVSGQLDLEPPQGSPVTALGDQMVRGVDPGKLQPPSNHRSIYLPVVRDYLPDLFDRFDFPSPSLVSGRRTVTNVPAQALYLRNSPFVAEQALHAARRLLATGKTPAKVTGQGTVKGAKSVKSPADAIASRALVNRAMRWTLARPATEAENQAALALVRPILNAKPPIKNGAEAAWATLFRALFATAEFRYLVDIEPATTTTPQATPITDAAKINGAMHLAANRSASLREEIP